MVFLPGLFLGREGVFGVRELAGMGSRGFWSADCSSGTDSH